MRKLKYNKDWDNDDRLKINSNCDKFKKLSNTLKRLNRAMCYLILWGWVKFVFTIL